MTHEWKPGDVAMVECSDGNWHRAAFRQATFMGHPDAWAFEDGCMRRVTESRTRPLVVIDPEDRDQAIRLTELWYQNDDQAGDPHRYGQMQAALREFAKPTPPKPDEPKGLGAVVECEHRVYDWARAVRIGNGFSPWYYTDSSGNGGNRAWDDIAAVRVLSEGVAQ